MDHKDSTYFYTFWHVSKAITSTLELKSVLNIIVERTAEALNAKGCTLRLFDKSREKLELCASHGLSEHYLSKGPVDAEASIAQALQGNPAAVLDATNDPSIQYPEEAKKEGISSILSVPMNVRKRIIGVMRVYTDMPYEFQPEEIELVSALAEQGSIAIENATLIENLKRDYRHLMEDFHMWFAEKGSRAYSPGKSSVKP